MLINFLDARLSPHIECSTIASEGYEIENLLSESHFTKGFLAERFVTGPVFITIKFICPVTIKYIKIWSKVCNQRSIGFELSALRSSDTSVADPEFKRFASGVIPNENDGVVFHKEGIPVDERSLEKRSFYRCKHHENTISLRIKIFKSRCVPALKRLEVWGEPGYLCPRRVRSNVYKLWLKVSRTRPDAAQSQEESVVGTPSQCTVLQIPESDVPEEFYDQITHEIMTLPMILPSGKAIDNSTLEKFQEEEQRWGRLPSDPFTGLLFTEASKPMIATTLKGKIDAFLLQYSNLEEVKTLPRRLGLGSQQPDSIRISKIVDAGKRKATETVGEPGKRRKSSDTTGPNGESELEKMLRKTLSNLPSFLSKPPDNEQNSAACVQCSVSEQLYRLPCEHILCRVCVLGKQNQCSSCDLRFSFSQIEKIHVQSL